MPWPEQDVTVVAENTSPQVRSVRFRVLDDGVKQMIVSVPRLAAGEEATALVTLEIVKRDIVAPPSTGQLRRARDGHRESCGRSSAPVPTSKATIPAFARRPGRWWPRNHWPGNKSKRSSTGSAAKSSIDSIATSKVLDKRSTTDSVTVRNSPRCLSPCAAPSGFPPAAVWVPGHCYPEFYLEDEQGQGHWYPCQAAGTRIFGAMPEARPILQKGDSFRVPGSRQALRYVQETLTAKNAAADPEVQFVQKSLDAPDASAK